MNKLISFDDVLSHWKKIMFEWDVIHSSGLFISDQYNWENPDYDDAPL